MLDYLKKFNDLPADLRQKVSDDKAMAKIEALEKKYNAPLAALIMKIMVKEVALDDLADYLLKENLPKERAAELARELRENIFSSLGNYFSAGAAKNAKAALPAMAAPASPPFRPPVSQPKVKGANFFFSSDDEEEIRELTQKIVMAENSAVTSGTIDDKVEEITDRAKINFGSAELAERFSKILKTYLRGIRNKLEAKAALMKPFPSGGLSFDENSAEKVISLADKVLNSKPGRPIEPLPEIKSPGPEKSGAPLRPEISRDAAYDFSKLAGKGKNSAQGESLPAAAHGASSGDFKKPDTGHELAPLTPAVVSAGVARPNAPRAGGKAPVPSENLQAKAGSAGPVEPAPKDDLGTMPLIKRRFKAENLSQSQKVKIEDVKYVPRVMGPLDEIKYMDLINFRRLGREPRESADKIKNKINLLGEEDYGKKLEGVKFWRLSPVNKLYLEIGHLSISENKPVDVIIEERKMNNQEYLTAEEFKAIMDLNKNLRF